MSVVPPPFDATCPPACAPALPASWLQPQWPDNPRVQALFTSREGGVSQAPWDRMNLGDHVHDDPAAVAVNRAYLQQCISALAGQAVQPVFLQQVHGCAVAELQPGDADGAAFDACVTTARGVACTIMVADCLPVLLAHQDGLAVAAAHAGWRGLVGEAGHGVLEGVWAAYARAVRRQAGTSGEALTQAQIANRTQVWLGPCIGPQAFEVGAEVRAAFVANDAQAAQCFAPVSGAAGQWRADLPALARRRLAALGLQAIAGNDGSAAWCTVAQASRFFSHRRDAARLGSTGRMAAAIWLR